MLFEIYKKQVKYVCKRIYKYKGDDRNPIWDFITNDNGYSLQIPDAIKTNRGRSRLIGAR